MENWGKFLDPQNSILVFSLTTGVDKNITIEGEKHKMKMVFNKSNEAAG